MSNRAIQDIDIYRSANLVIEQYGEDSVIEAAMRADAMLEKGHIDGQRIWLAIMRAIEEVQRAKKAPGEHTH